MRRFLALIYLSSTFALSPCCRTPSSNEVTQQEYEVYSSIIQLGWLPQASTSCPQKPDNSHAILVVDRTLTGKEVSFHLDELKKSSEIVKSIPPGILAKYEQLLGEAPSLLGNISLFHTTLKPILIKETQTVHICDHPEDWGAFFKQYPGSLETFLMFSRVSFDSTGTLAFVYVRQHGCGFGSAGYFWLLEKSHNKWHKSEKLPHGWGWNS